MAQKTLCSHECPSRPGNRRTISLACLALATIFAVAAISGCSASTTQNPQTSQPAQTQPAPAPAPNPQPAAQLEVKDIKVGKGAAAKSGDNVTVNYTGWLEGGTKFDSSIGKQPFSFPLGAGQVIPGWDQGVVGMKVGGKRELIIPPDLGYGAQGSPPVIPPNATLKFEVEMLEIK